MEDGRYFTLVSAAGRFVFPKGTILAHAKLIRDSITGSLFGHGVIAPKIDKQKPEKAMVWIKDYVAGPLSKANIRFEWIPS